MPQVAIDTSLELCEILGAFPHLKEKLDSLQFNTSSVKDGISFHDYFHDIEKLTDEEISLLVRRLSADLNKFLNRESPLTGSNYSKEQLRQEEEEE